MSAESDFVMWREGRYRKKPVVIEAIQWTGENQAAIREWSKGELYPGTLWVMIPTLEGEMTACVGDWIIRGVQGEMYPCKPDIFEATYEVAT